MRTFHLYSCYDLSLPIARVIYNVNLILHNDLCPIHIKTLILLIVVASQTFRALISQTITVVYCGSTRWNPWLHSLPTSIQQTLNCNHVCNRFFNKLLRCRSHLAVLFHFRLSNFNFVIRTSLSIFKQFGVFIQIGIFLILKWFSCSTTILTVLSYCCNLWCVMLLKLE